MRLLGESAPDDANSADHRTLICADPVNLDFIQQAMVLSSIDSRELDANEAAQLIASLNEEFAGEGHFFTGNDNHHWYFAPTDASQDLPQLAACSRLLGRRIDADESRLLLGRDGLRWMNRIQMCLNSHPVNEERQMQGLTPINSIWPWGTGQLANSPEKKPVPFKQASGQDALLRGLCKATGTLQIVNEPLATGLVLETSLATAIARDDLDDWQLKTQTLIQSEIAPAMAQLCSSKLSTLTLIAPDATCNHTWTLHASHKKLRPSLFQRFFGSAGKNLSLQALIQSW